MDSEAVEAVYYAAGEIHDVCRRIHGLTSDLKRELHLTLNTTAPWIDRKLPPDVLRSLEQIDDAAADLRDIGKQLLREMPRESA